MSLDVIILAAGKGTRMKSDTLKVLHQVAGKPILQYVVDTVLKCDVDHIYLVVGHQEDKVKELIRHPKISYVRQEKQLGTGHAVLQVEPHIKNHTKSDIFVLAGDCPLIEETTLSALLAIHQESSSRATVLTTKLENPASYGRILRGRMGTMIGIKEAKDCTPEELAIQEINTGVYVFDSHALFRGLKKITTSNSQQEYYLTDVIHILKDEDQAVEAYCTSDSSQAIGINTREDISKTNKILYTRNNIRFMQDGVTIIDPDTTFIDSTVKIGQDTVVFPFCNILGNTVIGANCEVGPQAYIKDGYIEAGSVVPPFTYYDKRFADNRAIINHIAQKSVI